MKWLYPRQDKTIPFLILITFLVTFIISRLTTFLFPTLHVYVRGLHVHHFTYGIILLSLVGLISLITNLSYKGKLRLSLLYGVALGLAFDEFAMWLELEDIYHDRRNYDAILVISLIFLNIIYGDSFWKKWGHRLHKLLYLLIGAPKASIHLCKRCVYAFKTNK